MRGAVISVPPVVLVVEDEPLILMDTADFLSEAGYQVVEAANADEAIEIIADRNDIGVVVTDVDMPGTMDGLQLAAVIREKWPRIELVIVSGKTHVGPDRLPERALFLGKPYQQRQLLRCLSHFEAAPLPTAGLPRKPRPPSDFSIEP